MRRWARSRAIWRRETNSWTCGSANSSKSCTQPQCPRQCGNIWVKRTGRRCGAARRGQGGLRPRPVMLWEISRLISHSMTGRGRSPPWPRRAAPHRRPVLFTQIFPHCRGHCGCVQLFELFAEPHVQLFVSLRQIALERAQRLIIQFRFKCYFAQNIFPPTCSWTYFLRPVSRPGCNL